MDIKLDKLRLSGSLLKTIFIETLRGESLSRTLRDYTLSQVELSGKVLDPGSGSDSPGHRRLLRYKEPFSITYSDYYKEGMNLVKINLEEPFEIEQSSYNYVTCLSALEHIYNFKNVIRESHKILKEEGEFIGSTPFVRIFHPDPYDYFRYSHQALTRMFEEENFVCQRMVYLGFGPFTLAVNQWTGLLPAVLRPVFVFFSIALDVLFSKFTKSPTMRYALNYFYIFRKN